MLFNSIDFVLFLPIVIIGYYLIPAKYRWIFLLAASYYFYMCWKAEYVILILISTGIDYFSGLRMGRLATKKERRPYLILSLLANIGLLFSFKYFNFFSTSATYIAQSLDYNVHFPLLDVLLPVGISFYTFQTLSYSIDVYRGQIKPEKHLGHFALYVSFFPQLVAGPIERFSSLSPQLKATHKFNYDNLRNGLRLILFGLFTKMVIADNAAPIVDKIFEDPDLYNSASIGAGLFFYSFQLYCDFFGYSVIAIGSALIMGINIMDNFNVPYLATSIADFWRRWHISLSTWFRDYIYFPMGGNRTKKARWMFNIITIFVVSGFWHGAHHTYMVWGIVVGILYLVEKQINKALGISPVVKPYSVSHFLRAIKTFVIITLTWILFRSDSLEGAWNMCVSLFTNYSVEGKSLNIPLQIWVLLIGFIFVDWALYNKRFDGWIGRMPFAARWSIYAVLLFSIIVFAGVEEIPFIYFQF